MLVWLRVLIYVVTYDSFSLGTFKVFVFAFIFKVQLDINDIFNVKEMWKPWLGTHALHLHKVALFRMPHFPFPLLFPLIFESKLFPVVSCLNWTELPMLFSCISNTVHEYLWFQVLCRHLTSASSPVAKFRGWCLIWLVLMCRAGKSLQHCSYLTCGQSSDVRRPCFLFVSLQGAWGSFCFLWRWDRSDPRAAVDVLQQVRARHHQGAAALSRHSLTQWIYSNPALS